MPIFARSTMWGDGARLYPYYFFNKFSGTGVDQEWPVVRLENPYISVAVLPKVGGKVWGATDKVTGRDFLYTNHVMKFREIALRGPWTSGGIEFNFGIVGHSPTTATPVDYVLRRDPDGSVSCVVGAMDLPSRTRWSVTIRLPKDKAYFETNGAWYNPTPFSQSYYYWSCGAIKTADDLRYIFPGRWQIGHDYNVPLEPWPVDSLGPRPVLVPQQRLPRLQELLHRRRARGFLRRLVREERRRVRPLGPLRRHARPQGLDLGPVAGRRDLGRPADRQGRPVHRAPGRAAAEPVRPRVPDFGRRRPLARAVVPLQRHRPHDRVLARAACSTSRRPKRRWPSGSIRSRPSTTTWSSRPDGKEIHRERIKAEPAKPLKKDLPLAVWPAGLSPSGSANRSSIIPIPAADDLERPLRFKPVDESTAEGLFLSGTRSEKARYFGQALEKYAACLAKEPAHMGALTRSAELYFRRGEYAKALTFAAKALDYDMYNPAANYVYGVVARRIGKLDRRQGDARLGGPLGRPTAPPPTCGWPRSPWAR